MLPSINRARTPVTLRLLLVNSFCQFVPETCDIGYLKVYMKVCGSVRLPCASHVCFQSTALWPAPHISCTTLLNESVFSKPPERELVIDTLDVQSNLICIWHIFEPLET
ncbi:hypothetical protein EG68_07297 [Paragonimus skrjabini miyazakii]|uniref:Uncharacterized protein n=1 Tax=Paragonimus skrjabini miyazakii TaxID=59628 RepID=A0A8S9Y891_9TREM|nr:hypothetical protein EG68_07297 [Paragonimus skrjabini miyazakii]